MMLSTMLKTPTKVNAISS